MPALSVLFSEPAMVRLFDLTTEARSIYAIQNLVVLLLDQVVEGFI